MTNLNQHYEGQTDGTPVNVANSTTYGDSASSNVTATNGTVTYSSAQAAHGARSVKLAMNSGATTSVLSLGLGGINTTSIATRCYMNFGDYPNAAVRLISVRSPTADLGGININANGTISVTDVAGVYVNTGSTTTQVLQLSAWYRLELTRIVSATAGQYRAAVYQGDSTSAMYSYTSASTMNSGTTNITEVRVGHVSTGGVFATPWYIDDFSLADGASTFLGPYMPSGPSVSTTITPGYAKLNATGSTAVNGGALTYSLSPSTNVIQPSTGIFYVPQASTATTYTLTVSESGGGSTSKSVTIPALTAASSSQTTVMTQRFIGGAWQ